MKTDHEILLRDVLQDENYTQGRQAIYQASLRELRRRRWATTRRQLLALAATLLLVGVLFLPFFRRSPSTPPATPTIPIAILRSVSMPASQIIRTGSRAPNQMLHTVLDSSQILAGSPAFPELIQTQNPPVEIVSDQGLLGLFTGHPVALLPVKPGAKQLWFFNPDDQAQFFGKP